MVVLSLFAADAARPAEAVPPAAAAPPAATSFERQILPILTANCLACHGEDTSKAQLDARQARLLIKGGKSGAAIVPGDSGGSLLYRRISKGEMPPGSRPKLTPEEIALIRGWIDAGAHTDAPEKEFTDADETFVTRKDQRKWAFQAARESAIPAFTSTDRVRTPIDAFLIAPLRQKQIGFSPDADKVTLLRRAYFDLIGLPPSPDRIDAFLADAAPDA
jgi:mono/diheme cytochrome c family protein